MMKYVPAEKRSKSARRELASSRRGSWNGVSPVSRIEPNPRAYDRLREKRLARKETEE